MTYLWIKQKTGRVNDGFDIGLLSVVLHHGTMVFPLETLPPCYPFLMPFPPSP
jgi:hypothetical protein